MVEEEIVITYETIFDLLRREKTRSELQNLPKEFSLKIVDYINTENDLSISQELSYTEKEKIKRELVNFKKLLIKLHQIRERKIIDMILLKLKTMNIPPDGNNLTTDEEDLFNNVEKVLIKSRKSFLDNVYSRIKDTSHSNQTKTKDISQKQSKNPNSSSHKIIKVEFIKDMEKFIGPNLENYGPFEVGDTTDLPEIIVDILKKQDTIKEL